MAERADELEYLRWFAMNADFGPAHSDVMSALQEKFETETGKLVAVGWRYADDEEYAGDYV